MRSAPTRKREGEKISKRFAALKVGKAVSLDILSTPNATRTQAHALARKLGIKIQTEHHGSHLFVTRIA